MSSADYDLLDSANVKAFGGSSDSVKSALDGKLVISIDYGNRSTGVAFAVVPTDTTIPARLADIKLIRDWNDNTNSERVPSAYSYNRSSGEEQWGQNVSADEVPMISIKRRLDVQESILDQLGIVLHYLDGTYDLNFDHVQDRDGHPEFIVHKPEIVVQLYMEKIFKHVMKRFEAATHIIRYLQVDIVITHPMVWSYKAKNAIYRAVTLAGFNRHTFPNLQDILMISEEKAAAIYATQFFKEQDPDETSFKKDDALLLCDAGGTSVDVTAFQVVETQPILELAEIGIPHSRTCGSDSIDVKFKMLLRDHVLGLNLYQTLEPGRKKRLTSYSTTKKMKDIMKQFVEHKHHFTGSEDDDLQFTIELPKEFEDLTVEYYAKEGQLTLFGDVMQWLFEESVDYITHMVKQQKREVGKRRIKNLYVIGGFSESMYLQSALGEELSHLGIKVCKPERSWSAAAIGGAFYGIEKNCLKPHVKAASWPCSYGLAQDLEVIRAAAKFQGQHQDIGKALDKSQMSWIVSPGDLAFPSALECQSITQAFNFREHDEKNFRISVWRSLKDGYRPTFFQENDTDLEIILSIPISFAETELDIFELYEAVGGGLYYQAIVSVYLAWENERVKVTVIWNDKVIYSNHSEQG